MIGERAGLEFVARVYLENRAQDAPVRDHIAVGDIMIMP
jgi:hypothetical protein